MNWLVDWKKYLQKIFFLSIKTKNKKYFSNGLQIELKLNELICLCHTPLLFSDMILFLSDLSAYKWENTQKFNKHKTG